MTDFKNIKHFNCSLNLNFNLTHLLTVGVMLSSNSFLEEVIFFIDCLTTAILKVLLNMLPENIEFKPP